MPRVVLDTNVHVSALIARSGAPARLLEQLRAGAFESIVSPLLLDELREVLHRDRFRRHFTQAEADAYVALIRSESVVVEDPPASRQHPIIDPDDAFLVDLARASRADAIISGDARLLDLRHLIPVLTPAEFLARILDEDG